MKKTRIILFTLIAILLFICCVIVTLYYTTDIFKTNEQMFIKSFSKIDLFDMLDYDFTSKYIKKLETTPSKSVAKISANASYEGEAVLDNLVINIEDKIDPVNKLEQGNMKVNYQNNETLNISYLRNADLYGIIIDGILNNYMVVENKNLKEFASKLGISYTESIPDKIETNQISEIFNIIDANKEQLSRKYMEVIFSQISKENYTKQPKSNIQVDEKQISAVGYKLILSEKDLYNIIINVLKAARDDETIFNLINTASSSNKIELADYQEAIDELIESIEEDLLDATDEEVIAITLYNSSGKTVKADIEIKDTNLQISFEFSDNKTVFNVVENEDPNYSYSAYTSLKITKTITVSGENLNLTFLQKSGDETVVNLVADVSRDGSIDSNNIKNNMKIEAVAEGYTININIDNEVNFISSIGIDKFEEGDYIILNDASEEELSQFFEAFAQKLIDKLGLTDYINTMTYNTINQVEEAEAMLEEQQLVYESQSQLVEETD